jgi:CheY-like chemotaxis protein
VKLTYNVLCLDDKISLLDDDKKNLSLFNSNVGIETKYTDIEVKIGPRDDPENFWMNIVGKIEESFTENTFDMILVDLHMGALSGADIIDSIRNNHTIYRPIIFYSAGEPETDDEAIRQLNEAATETNLLGKSVLITSRKTLYNKASSIFSEMHNEEHKVNRVRGLLMDRVSEFDASVGDLVQNEDLFKLIPAGAAKTKILFDVNKYLKADLDRAEGLYNEIKLLDVGGLQDFIKANPIGISTYRKGYLLKAILKQVDVAKGFSDILSEGIDGLIRNEIGDEVKNLREIRNEYGHITAENLEAIHTDEKCIHIRKEARRQLKNIDDIRACIEDS